MSKCYLLQFDKFVAIRAVYITSPMCMYIYKVIQGRIHINMIKYTICEYKCIHISYPQQRILNNEEI